MITLVYQRRSGITHMVTEPMPQILTAFGDDVLTIDELTQRLADQFDLGDDPINTQSILSARLQELEALGLVLALRNTAQDNGDA